MRKLISLVVLLALTAAVSAGPVFTDGLVAYLSFDNAGNLGADGSGMGNDGTIQGDITSAAGVYGGAALFGGKEGTATYDRLTNTYKDSLGNIVTPSGSWFDLDGANFNGIPTSAITISCWASVSQLTNPNAIFCTYAENAANAANPIWVPHFEVKSNGMRTTLRGVDESTGAWTAITDGTSRGGNRTVNQWIHVALTYDKAAAEAILYIGGVAYDVPVAVADDLANNYNYGAYIGCNVDDRRNFTGLMDEFYLYNRALSAGEITDLMNNVPEPATLVMLGLGAFSLIRKKNS